MTQPTPPPTPQPSQRPPAGTTTSTGRPLLPLTPASKALPPPRFTGSSGAAVIQAVIALLVAVTLVIEPPGGYTVPVWDGPRSLVAWLPGDPWLIWAAILAAPAIAVLIGRGAPYTRWASAALAGAWAGLGGGAAYAGLTDDRAASVAGWLLLGLSVLAIRDAAALSRRRS